MEASGRQLWRLLRPIVITTGPLKVLRRMGPDGYLYDRIPQVVEQWGAKRVLRRLGVDVNRLSVDENPINVEDAARERLADLATAGKRLSLSREAADRVALDLLDACAKLPDDNPGATVVESIVEAIGTKVASMESPHYLQAWRVKKKIFVTMEDCGACGVSDNLNDLLDWWLREDDADYVIIECASLKASLIRTLGFAPTDEDDAERLIRVNGRWWKRRDTTR